MFADSKTSFPDNSYQWNALHNIPERVDAVVVAEVDRTYSPAMVRGPIRYQILLQIGSDTGAVQK